MTTTTKPQREGRNPQIRQGTLELRDNPYLQIPLCSQLLLHQKEGWQTLSSTRLSTVEQVDEEK